MLEGLSFIDIITLLLYTLALGGIVGGAWLFWLGTGKQRIWSLVLLIKSLAAAVILTLMSTKYWFGRKGIIDISIQPILAASAAYCSHSDWHRHTVLLPILIGIGIILFIAYLIMKLSQQVPEDGIAAALSISPYSFFNQYPSTCLVNGTQIARNTGN